MPLDAQELLKQIEAVTPQLRESFQTLDSSLEEALALYAGAQAEEWRALVQESQAGEVLGYPYGPLRQRNPVAAPPDSYTVVATDGSVIPPDRHNGTALYHVINTGRVMLRYGPERRAEIDSRTLFSAGEVTGEEQEVSAPLVLDLKRDREEVYNGLDLARDYAADLFLMDGPLTMWNSRTLTDRQSSKLREDYYTMLGSFQNLRVPVAGYISNTHSRGVTNSLKLLLNRQAQPALFQLDDSPAPAYKSRSRRGKERLTGLGGVHDALLFGRLLEPGQYSEVFKSAFKEPKELAEHIGAVCFVYWRTETEVVRLEFPQWLVDEGHLPQVMSIVKEQHRLGQGYPVALMEAHEAAVLRSGDRELLHILLEERGLLQAESEKGRSKRLRGI